MEKALAHFADKILCDNSTGFDEVDNYFTTEADIMIGIVYNDCSLQPCCHLLG